MDLYHQPILLRAEFQWKQKMFKAFAICLLSIHGVVMCNLLKSFACFSQGGIYMTPSPKVL